MDSSVSYQSSGSLPGPEVSNDTHEVGVGRHRERYNWKEFFPSGGNLSDFVQWLGEGVSPKSKLSDDEMHANLISLSRLLFLLRQYEEDFGLPEQGGPKDQEYILREMCKDLYAGGAPIWALEPVMQRAAEGLTGKRGVDFFFLPRKAFIFAPTSGATCMFAWNRGFCISLLSGMETVAVRLASYASNTNSVASLPSRLPNPAELRRAYRGESVVLGRRHSYDRDELAAEILDLASNGAGLAYYINSKEAAIESIVASNESTHPMDRFWKVEDSTRELFCRLAAKKALVSIEKIDSDRKVLYSPWVVIFFRIFSSAGACAFWFSGSWYDMIVSGALAVLVAFVGSSTFLSRHERLIFEVVASFIVGLVSGLIALRWPYKTCFGAMAIAGVLDILQGFRVVYAIIEIMSKHTVTGGADFLEGILFTGLIAYSLKFGQSVAVYINGMGDEASFETCGEGIDLRWYLLFVPLAAVSWSGLFNPHYVDLPLMAFHGILAYSVSFGLGYTNVGADFNNFIAATVVTFSAGLLSRFTGRQALGNTIAGLYVLLPGAYLVNEVFENQTSGFLESVVARAVLIGLGSWMGTILCSPTLFGASRSMLQAPQSSAVHKRNHDVQKVATGAVLFF